MVYGVLLIPLFLPMYSNNRRRTVHEGHKQIDPCRFECHALSVKTQVTERKKEKQTRCSVFSQNVFIYLFISIILFIYLFYCSALYYV